MRGNKKKKINLKKVFFLMFVLIVVFITLLFVVNKLSKKEKVVSEEVEIIDVIDNFDYELNDNETKYYNELFSSLKELLKEETYDEKEYAVLIGQLFLADFYDLDSKVMKSDVGGTQFVYADYRNDFELGAIDTVYKYVESNVYGDRKQELPIVKKVEVLEVSNISYEYGNTSDTNAYLLKMNISYDKNLDYPNQVELVLIHNSDKLEVAGMETK